MHQSFCESLLWAQHNIITLKLEWFGKAEESRTQNKQFIPQNYIYKDEGEQWDTDIM